MHVGHGNTKDMPLLDVTKGLYKVELVHPGHHVWPVFRALTISKVLSNLANGWDACVCDKEVWLPTWMHRAMVVCF